VEAEIGELPCGASGTVHANGADMTDASAAARFVEQTGIDLLAISVGNVHIMVNGQQALDLDRLRAIHRRLPDMPLVLHGGTGIDAESVRAAVKLGVTKVNYGTYVKQRYLAALRDAYAKSTNINPHELLGMGGEDDLLVIGRRAVCDAVVERIELLGCAGKG
jgi:fructose-bisphosphate aldolase class II